MLILVLCLLYLFSQRENFVVAFTPNGLKQENVNPLTLTPDEAAIKATSVANSQEIPPDAVPNATAALRAAITARPDIVDSIKQILSDPVINNALYEILPRGRK
jgi:hypothetical protein